MCEEYRGQAFALNKFQHIMKSTKVQTLGAVTLLATAACTDDTNIVGLSPL